jgi:hypothetical protein
MVFTNRSTVHFRNAVSSAVSSTFTTVDDGEQPTAPPQDPNVAQQESRGYVCNHPHCFKAYKQPSGLRYHLKHVSQLRAICVRSCTDANHRGIHQICLPSSKRFHRLLPAKYPRRQVKCGERVRRRISDHFGR